MASFNHQTFVSSKHKNDSTHSQCTLDLLNFHATGIYAYNEHCGKQEVSS